MADSPDRVAKALKNTLDAHGYSFHYSVLRCCDELFSKKRSRWRFEVAEFPVDVKGDNSRIDFVLRGHGEFTDVVAYLVCECKRPNPAINHWAFVRAPYTRRGRNQRFTVFESIWLEEPSKRLLSAPLKFRDLVEPYDLAIELRGDPKGESCGPGRGAIEDAVTQALLGVGGLINFLKDHPHQLEERSVVIPVVFTTAQLFTSGVDLGGADLSTGKLPTDLVTARSSWLWYQYNLAVGMRHSAPKVMPDGGLSRSLGSVLEYQHARSIAIVGPDGIETFLQQMPNGLEDLEKLRP
jgi:hypothetical protein